MHIIQQHEGLYQCSVDLLTGQDTTRRPNVIRYILYAYTVIPRLTSDPANFSANEGFSCFLDSANEYGFG